MIFKFKFHKYKKENDRYPSWTSGPVQFIQLLMSLHLNLVNNYYIRAIITSSTKLLYYSLQNKFWNSIGEDINLLKQNVTSKVT